MLDETNAENHANLGIQDDHREPTLMRDSILAIKQKSTISFNTPMGELVTGSHFWAATNVILCFPADFTNDLFNTTI